jgi:copper chaperone CopZ
MPDVTLEVPDLAEAGAPERVERALGRLSFVLAVNADAEKGLLAVSYEGGEKELRQIEDSVKEAGFSPEPSPGAREAGG